MSRFLRPIFNLAIAGGLVLAAWPLGQTVYARWSQNQLAAQFERDAFAAKPVEGTVTPKREANAPKIVALAQPTRLKKVRNASDPAFAVATGTTAKRPWPLTKLSIPDIGLETFVIQGWDDATLRRGPGHLPSSSTPGAGNCVIAGHRNVYGSHFYRIDELLPGSQITLENRAGRFTYIVNSTWTTPDTNVGIVQPPAPGQTPILTLVTCTLPHTNNRVILQAKLSEY